MPNNLRPKRQDASLLSDGTVVALLAGTEPPADPGPGLQPVADLLTALRADPTGDELAGEASALEEFRRGTALLASPHRLHHRRPRAFTSRFTTKAAAASLAVISLGGLTTAAFAGVLPPPIQRVFHDALHVVPAAPHHSTPGAHPSRSHTQGRHQAAASEVKKLCAAYVSARASGTAEQQTIALHQLITAIHGAGKITEACGMVVPGPGMSGARPAHHGKRVPPGEQNKGKHHKNAAPGQQNKNVPPGQQNKKVPPGEQNEQNSNVPAGQHVQPGKGNPPGQHNQDAKGNPPGQQGGQHGTHPHNKLSASHPVRGQHRPRTRMWRASEPRTPPG